MMAEPGAPIPGRLNLCLVLMFIAIDGGCLWSAAHGPWWAIAPAALVFSFTNHALYLLMHEAVHGILYPRRWLNELIGSLIAPTFPHAFCLQRAFHLSHHRNNRTDGEFLDGYYPYDRLFAKRWQWYGILLGEYWLRVPAACLLWLFCPWVLRSAVLRGAGNPTVQSFGGGDMLWSLERMPPLRSRLEVVLTIVVQIGAWYALELTPVAWLACYGAFALNWGAHQYTVHAWSERDVRNGAWNLQAPRWQRWALLNVYDHLAHHQHPRVPWRWLPRFRDATRPSPDYWATYWSLWRGPRPAWGTSPTPELAAPDDPDMGLRSVSAAAPT